LPDEAAFSHLVWGPVDVMPGVPVTLNGPMTAAPGDGGACILTAAGEQYTFRAAGGASWTVVPPGGAPFVLSERLDLLAGTMLQVQLSPEEAARQQAQARLAREAEEERRRAAAARQELAGQRLVAWMNEEQRRSYEDGRSFVITASDGSPWRIVADGSQSGNVLELDGNGEVVRSYCAHPRASMAAETYLAQALSIMTDVARFKMVANVYYTYQPQANVTFSAAGGGDCGGITWSGLLQALRR
jgi:hypothetical protein